MKSPLSKRRSLISQNEINCLGESDWLRTLNPKNWTGDKGYIGDELSQETEGRR
jgi:hypothetical protein